MPRYKVTRAYKAGPFSTRDSGDVHWDEGQEVELDDAEAEYRNHDSEGLLVPIDDVSEEAAAVGPDSTKAELVAYAEANGIDLVDARTKAEIVAVLFPDAESGEGAMSTADDQGLTP
jgi:hypothetical protein